MRIEIRVGEGDESAALDLYRWLRRDRDIRRHADLSLGSARPGDGAMGAADLIDLVLGHGIAALNLALSYAAWRATRSAAPSVTFTVDGRSVTVQGRCDEETVRMIADVLDGRTDDTRQPQDDLETV
jgi:hypothetical protein